MVKSGDGGSKSPQSKKAARAARLAKELRANLKRRKSAADERQAAAIQDNDELKQED